MRFRHSALTVLGVIMLSIIGSATASASAPRVILAEDMGRVT